jgi:hypothetical protein
MRRDPLVLERRTVGDQHSRLLAAGLNGLVYPSRNNWTARMSRSTDQAILISTETVVDFTVRDKDVGYEEGGQQADAAMVDLTNNRFEIRQLGCWIIAAHMPWQGDATGTVRRFRFFLNGAAMMGGRFNAAPITLAGEPTIVYGSVQRDFVRGDLIDVRVFQNATGATLDLVAAEGIIAEATWVGL